MIDDWLLSLPYAAWLTASTMPLGLMLGSSCSPCCKKDKCVAWKSEGWSGSRLDFGEMPLNGDGIFFAGTVSVPSVLSDPNDNISFTITETELFATLALPSTTSIVRLKSTDVEQFLAGDEVLLSEVVENTTPSSVDNHGRKAVDTVGTITVRLQSPAGSCTCDSCEPNRFDTSLPLVLPSTYTLQFTNVGAAPSGPRGKAEFASTLSNFGGFLPPNSWRNNFTNTLYAGCDSYVERFTQPIILRQVDGAPYVYLSDPINISPCEQVRYRLDTCEPPRPRAKLSATRVQRDGFSGGIIRGLPPLCGWDFLHYSEDPQSFSDEYNAHVYQFGWFATATPGGEYAPEPIVDCGGDASLAELCFGTKCPPTSIYLEISGSAFDELNATFEIPAVQGGIVPCGPSTGAATTGSVFAGSRGGFVADFEFAESGNSWNFRITRQAAQSPLPFQLGIVDTCPCESRIIAFYAEGMSSFNRFRSTNGWRFPPDNSESCQPMCHDSDIEVGLGNIRMQETGGNSPSTFPVLGNVKIILPAAT